MGMTGLKHRKAKPTADHRDRCVLAGHPALSPLWRGLGLMLVLAVGLLSLVPSPPPPPALPGWDKAQHLLAYLVLAWWCLQCWPHQAVWTAVALLAYGAALEGLQGLAPARHPEGGDMLANALGVAAGAWLLRWPPLRLLPLLDRLTAGALR